MLFPQADGTVAHRSTSLFLATAISTSGRNITLLGSFVRYFHKRTELRGTDRLDTTDFSRVVLQLRPNTGYPFGYHRIYPSEVSVSTYRSKLRLHATLPETLPRRGR